MLPLDALGHLAMIRGEMERRWQRPASPLEEMCSYALLPSGKMFRPVLLVESAVAVGGRCEWVLPAAVGTECGHVASLIHDDVIDRDDLRRGRPSVPAAYGADDAIVAGDRLLFELFYNLAECLAVGVPATRIVASLAAVSAAGIDLCRGQALESDVTGDLTCTLEQYTAVVRWKTAALFRGACQAGALLGGGSSAEVDALASYGDHLGIAFQMHDDLLPYTSTASRAGKQVTSDIRNRRMTLPVILARDSGDSAALDALTEAFTSDVPEDVAFELVRTALDCSGAVSAGTRMAEEHAVAAIGALETLVPSPSREQLCSFASAAVRRDR